MEISIEELKELLEKEFQRGRESVGMWTIKTYDTTPIKTFTTNKACDNCSNSPKNGGSGLCNCILGMTDIVY